MKICELESIAENRLERIKSAATKIQELVTGLIVTRELDAEILNNIIDTCRIISNNAYRLDRFLEYLEDSPEDKEKYNG